MTRDPGLRRRPTVTQVLLCLGVVAAGVILHFFGQRIFFDEINSGTANMISTAAVPMVVLAAVVAFGTTAAAVVMKRGQVQVSVAGTVLVMAACFAQIRAENSLAVQKARIDEALVSYDQVMKLAEIDPTAGDVGSQALGIAKEHMMEHLVRVGGWTRADMEAPVATTEDVR